MAYIMILLFLIYLPNIIMLLHCLHSKYIQHDCYVTGAETIIMFIISILIPFFYWIIFLSLLVVMYDEKRKFRNLK